MHYNWSAISSALSLLIVHKFKIKILSFLSRQSIHKPVSQDCIRKKNIINFVLLFIMQEKFLLEEKEVVSVPFEGLEPLIHHENYTWEMDLNVIHSTIEYVDIALISEWTTWERENLKHGTYFFPFTTNNFWRWGRLSLIWTSCFICSTFLNPHNTPVNWVLILFPFFKGWLGDRMLKQASQITNH